MPLFSNRIHQCKPPSRFLARRATVLLLTAVMSGCVSYEPDPIEPLSILRELNSVGWNSSSKMSSDELGQNAAGPGGAIPKSLTAGQLAAFAISNNPNLNAVRARVGVSKALLIEARLLPDPEIGWDGMDVLASRIVDGTSSSVDFVAGFGISLTLPRPGELDALGGSARWRVERALREVTRVEWLLARDVHLAFEDVLAAENLLLQNEQLTKVVQDTDEYFQRAREAGVATAIESSLAHGDLLAIRADTLRLVARVREAKHGLNALVGLSPDASFKLDSSDESRALPDLPNSPDLLTELAVQKRPDLARLLAAYGVAEDEVRLEVARQFPQVSIGTGIWLVPGFFRQFNKLAIKTATSRRNSLRREVETAVYEIRRDVHDAWAELHETREEVRFLESELLPNAEDSLRLAGDAFAAGEATLVHILNVQRAVVDARTRHGEAQAELARRTWQLYAAGGLILQEQSGAISKTTEHDE